MFTMIAHKPFVTNHVLSSITLEKKGGREDTAAKTMGACQMATLLLGAGKKKLLLVK